MKQVGEYAWLLEWDDDDEIRANGRARAAAAALKTRKLPGLLEAVPAARTLLIVGDDVLDASALEDLEETPVPSPDPDGVGTHEIRVTPNGEDMPEVLEALGLAAPAFWNRFFGTTFTVGFLGFAPGFAYLYGLPEALQLPRRRSPRTAVVPGSVAMAGPYVGIYPASTPGGWNLLGTTTRRLFDLRGEPPFLFSPSDRVRFLRT